jgi:hypothetical protein
MKEIMFIDGFSLKELKDRINYLQSELTRITSRRKDNHNKRSFNLVNYSLSWLKTYTYLTAFVSKIDKETYEELYTTMMHQRNVIADYAVLGSIQR